MSPTISEPTGAEQLNGDVPMLGESVRWDLYDVDDFVLGELAVERAPSPPRISNDVGRTMRRQISGLRVPARPRAEFGVNWRYYAEDIAPLTMRVKPVWVLATGDEYALGTFVWGDDSRTIWSWGEPREGILLDLCVLLDQDLDENVGYDKGAFIQAALEEQADAVGIDGDHRIIEASDRDLREPIAWAAGRDKRLKVMESLCSLGGYLPPYFNNDGILVCRSAPDLASAAPDFVYGFGSGRVLPGSAVASNDILNAPNRYVTIDTASVETPLVGTFDVPDFAPNSFFNRGFHITRTVELQGLTDQAAADDAAAAAYAADSSTYSWLAFNTPPDPRHDTFDIIAFAGVNFRQLAWSYTLTPGAQMSHDCRSTYAVEDEVTGWV